MLGGSATCPDWPTSGKTLEALYNVPAQALESGPGKLGPCASSCVALSKLQNLSEPQILHGDRGGHESCNFWVAAR